jgi:hypothetical protein
MYLEKLKTAVVEAFRAEFATAVNPDFRTPNQPMISIEYPIDQSHYPGIWVQYADTQELTIASIDFPEITTTGDTISKVTRWKFGGTVTLTVVALSSWERDRLYDEVVASFTSARGDRAYPLRAALDSNDLVGMNVNFDDLQPFADQAGLGTPWGSDEVIYERSASFDVIGEFVSRPEIRQLVPLSSVTYMKYVEGTSEPPWPGPGSPTAPPTPGDWDRTHWS